MSSLQHRPSVFPVVLAGFTAFLGLYATQPLLPLLRRVFDASHFAVSLTVTASTIGVAVAAPIVGRVADLVGRRRVIVGSAFALAAATGLAATATSLPQFIGWRLVQGLGTAALGWLFVVYLVGAAVTPCAGRLVDMYGHRTGLTAGMAIGSLGAALTLTPALALIVIGLALVGTGVFIAQATASSYIGAVTTEHRGVAVGVYSSAYYLGGSLGGTLPSLVWTTGGWTACVLLVIVVQAATLGTALRFWRPAAGLPS